MYLLDEAGLLRMPNLKAAMIPGSPMLLNVHLSQGTYTRLYDFEGTSFLAFED